MTVLAHFTPGPPQDVASSALYVDDAGAPARRSYATYFNGFPAGYWSHSTVVDDVTLDLSLRGTGRVEVFRSDSTSRSEVVHGADVDGEQSVSVTLSLAGMDEGGWFWFDLLPDGDLEVVEATWSTDAEPPTTGLASIGITTFNKPDYCVRTLAALAASPGARSAIDTVYLVDQGTQKVADEPGFSEAAAELGDQLKVIDQANLGGSGGFSRSMMETLDAGTSDFTLLLDDDVAIEPEAIYRLVQFGRFCRTPTIVGGHMLDIFKPSVLHAWAEVIDTKQFLWKPGPPVHYRHDFSDRNLRATTWAHRRDDADYTGWWMCLIPTAAMRQIGLSLPAFIKWDDAEYSVRAAAANIPTVSMPGSALWHVAWVDKDDSREWQAYFHARNRIVAALVHSTYPEGGRLFTNLGRIDVKHLLSMEYYAAHLRERAYRDILKGPEHMHAEIGQILGELRAARGDFVENAVYATPQDIPDTTGGRLTYDIEVDMPPRRRELPVWTARHVARHWSAASPSPDSAPQYELTRRDATWWRLPLYDSVLVTDSARTSAVVYRRDRDYFRAQMKRNRTALRELRKNWDSLARDYRAALTDITSPEAWRATLVPAATDTKELA